MNLDAEELLILQEALSKRVREQLTQKYRLANEQLDWIELTDPSETGKYSMWIAAQMQRGLFVPNYGLRNTLQRFEQVVRSPQFTQPKQIEYYDSVQQLEAAVYSYQNRSARLQQRQQHSFEEYVAETTIMDTPPYKVLKITRLDQSSVVCRNTEWCIRNSEHFNHYEIGPDNPLYVILKDGEPYVAALFEAAELKQAWDDKAPTPEVGKEIRPIIDQIVRQESIAFDYLSGDFIALMTDKEALHSPRSALWYAQTVIRGPWPQGEPVIARTTYTALEYAEFTGKRFELGESAIFKDVLKGTDYIRDYIGHRVPEFEAKLLANENLYPAVNYADQVIKGPWPELEERLLQLPFSMANFVWSYIRLVKRTGWVEFRKWLETNAPEEQKAAWLSMWR